MTIDQFAQLRLDVGGMDFFIDIGLRPLPGVDPADYITVS
jgi:hypothetical protein